MTMSGRERIGIWCGIVAAAVSFLLASGHLTAPVRHDMTFPVMGTRGGFGFYSRGVPEQAQQAALAEFKLVSAVCNRFDPASELSRLNRSAADAPFRCSGLLWDILQEARRAHRLSGGAFDITIEPLMKLWGFYRSRPDSVPDAAAIAGAKKYVGLEKVRFDERSRSVFFTVPGITIDLGGIAKGYAVDRAFAAAVRCGIRSGVIDLGGNLRFMPEPPAGKNSYRVGIRDPEDPAELAELMLDVPGGTAVSTSGDYERFVTLRGRRYGHLIDPASGRPVTPGYAVTVTAPDAVTADWLSSTGFLRGREFAAGLEKQLPGVRFHFIASDGENAKF